MVVVEPEREPHVVDSRVTLGGDDDRSIRLLHGVHALDPVAGSDGGAIRAVRDDARRVARVAAGEA
jgi:hypothetical protein